MKLYTHPHCVYDIHYHLVLVTKYRKQCINEQVFETLKNNITKNSGKFGAQILEINYEPDHVHIVLSTHPNMNMSIFINSLKTASSRVVRSTHTEYLKSFYWKPVFWKRGYCLISTGGTTIDIIKKYINEQQH